jgi:hypothetical protein
VANRRIILDLHELKWDKGGGEEKEKEWEGKRGKEKGLKGGEGSGRRK